MFKALPSIVEVSEQQGTAGNAEYAASHQRAVPGNRWAPEQSTEAAEESTAYRVMKVYDRSY
jgi:hypothetical protein